MCRTPSGQDVPEVVCDERRELPGRGAWIHVDPKCVQAAHKKGAFHRAFRGRVNAAELDIPGLPG
ncbi:YlxR family protein [Rothia sp. LK2588]|uniref:YlxR family protein n=1 Tax=Rothia sp. LK2588 TaxID=3114369 RepID=UPI0034CED5C7